MSHLPLPVHYIHVDIKTNAKGWGYLYPKRLEGDKCVSRAELDDNNDDENDTRNNVQRIVRHVRDQYPKIKAICVTSRAWVLTGQHPRSQFVSFPFNNWLGYKLG